MNSHNYCLRFRTYFSSKRSLSLSPNDFILKNELNPIAKKQTRKTLNDTNRHTHEKSWKSSLLLGLVDIKDVSSARAHHLVDIG